jgi:hypothetical protein
MNELNKYKEVELPRTIRLNELSLQEKGISMLNLMSKHNDISIEALSENLYYFYLSFVCVCV